MQRPGRADPWLHAALRPRHQTKARTGVRQANPCDRHAVQPRPSLHHKERITRLQMEQRRLLLSGVGGKKGMFGIAIGYLTYEPLVGPELGKVLGPRVRHSHQIDPSVLVLKVRIVREMQASYMDHIAPVAAHELGLHRFGHRS